MLKKDFRYKKFLGILYPSSLRLDTYKKRCALQIHFYFQEKINWRWTLE